MFCGLHQKNKKNKNKPQQKTANYLIRVSKETLQKSTMTGQRRVEEQTGRGYGPRPDLPTCPRSGLDTFIIYTYEYIDETADRGVCRSIYFRYIDS